MTDNNNTSLAQLTSFLNKLFQFESQDLDFGVYKILHYKRKEIKQFIDRLKYSHSLDNDPSKLS
jgi:adenine-specific DNA-methyltransferase